MSPQIEQSTVTASVVTVDRSMSLKALHFISCTYMTRGILHCQETDGATFVALRKMHLNLIRLIEYALNMHTINIRMDKIRLQVS